MDWTLALDIVKTTAIVTSAVIAVLTFRRKSKQND